MKHTTFFYLVATAFVLVGATACSSGDDGDEPATNTPTNLAEQVRVPLMVDVSERPMSDVASAARGAITRTVITTATTLSDFKMDFHTTDDYYGSYTFSKSNNQWTADPAIWPQPDGCYPLRFYAYTAGAFNYNGPYIHVEVEETPFTQKDVLVARTPEFTKSTEAPIPLTFDHICAAVGFTISITAKLAGTLSGSALQVTSVKLQDIIGSGDYYYDTGWAENVSDVQTTKYTLNHSPIQVTNDRTELKDTEDNPFYLFVIPQSRDVSLEVKYKLSENGDEKTATIPQFHVNWLPGHRYYIHINLGTANVKI